MRGLMMDRPLLIQSLIRYAARYHARRDRLADHRGPAPSLYLCGAELRTKQLAKALMRLGVALGDRVATIAWNNHRHFEAYYAISGVGAVCHTINPRLFTDQLAYIVNHAQDKVLLVDLTFVPLVEKMAASWPAIQHYVVMTDRGHMPATSLPNVLCYEESSPPRPRTRVAGVRREYRGCALLHLGYDRQSKGALYSHRSTLLHTYALCASNNVGIGDARCALSDRADVPCQCLGIPYAAAMAGAKLVFPGPRLDGASLQGSSRGRTNLRPRRADGLARTAPAPRDDRRAHR